MSRILVTGATGTLGTALCPRLAEAGHTVRAASRSPPDDRRDADEWVTVDLVEGTGLSAALEDVDVVIHAATAPQGDTEAVDVDGTRCLLDAAAAVGVEQFLYPSIVGIDEIPFAYYDHKETAERAVEDSAVPATIVRATQFHQFVAELLDTVARLPVWPLPTKMQVQPIDVDEFADVIVEQAAQSAGGRLVPVGGRLEPVGGPEVHTVGELARAYRSARGLRRPIVRIPIPGGTTAAFRAGHATCPDHRVGTVTWESWLATRYGSGPDDAAGQRQPSA